MAIWEGPHAELREVAVNEIALDQRQEGTTGQPTLDDPVALRFGSWANPLGRTKWYIAKISLDVLRWVSGAIHRTEIGFLKLAVDELFDMDGKPLPMVALYLAKNTTGSADSDQQPVAIFTRDGIRFLVPVYGMMTQTGPAPKISRFYSDDGRYCFNVQGDDGGKIVQYDTHGSTNEQLWTPVGTLRAS